MIFIILGGLGLTSVFLCFCCLRISADSITP